MRPLFLTLALLVAGTALARKPQEFVAPREMTEDEIRAARSRPSGNMNTFHGDSPQEVTPFPWGAVLFMGGVLSVGLLFGLRMYARTSQELEGQNSFGVKRRAADD